MQKNKRELYKWVYKRHNWILRKLRKSQKMKIFNKKNFWEFKREIKLLQTMGYKIGIVGDLNIHLKENQDVD